MKHKKLFAWIGISAIAIAGIGAGAYFGIDQYVYARDLSTINSSYLNKKQKSLHEKLDINYLNSIPASYKYLHNKTHLSEIKSEYARIRPLYTTQIQTQQGVQRLYNGKSHYSDFVSDKVLQVLSNNTNKINNQSLQSKLIVKIDTIDLWLNQTEQAESVINKISKKSTIDFEDYVQAQANYSLIKNQKIKKQCGQQIKQIKAKYQNLSEQNKKNYQNKLKSEINSAKKQAEAKNTHAPANVTINVITKQEQHLSNLLGNADINSEKAIIMDDGTLYLMKKQDDQYYSIEHKIDLSDSNSVNSGTYTVNLTINSGQNGATNYSIQNKGALILDDSDSKYSKYTVLNIHGSDFNTEANYLSLNSTDKYILFNNDSGYLLFTDSSDSNSDNMIQVSTNQLNTIVSFLDKSTKILVE